MNHTASTPVAAVDVTDEATNAQKTTADRFSVIAGWCGLLAAAAYITTIAVASLFGSVEAYDGPADIVRYLQDVADNSARSIVYGIAGIVMSVLFIPFGIAIYRALNRTASALLGSLAMTVGLVCLIPAYAMSLIEGTVLASAVNDAGIDDQSALYLATEFAVGVMVIFFTVGSILTLCVAPLLWGVEGRRTGAFSKWINLTGIIVGVSGLVWFVWFFETPALLFVMLLNAVASLVYFIGLAINLRSKNDPVASRR